MPSSVTRFQIVARGLSNRCPNCGGRTLFKAGTWFQTNRNCPSCGLLIERDEGFFLGSMSLNYGVTLVCFVIAAVGSIVFPALFYRSSRSWWLMNYYFFVPQHLPANRVATAADGDENL